MLVPAWNRIKLFSKNVGKKEGFALKHEKNSQVSMSESQYLKKKNFKHFEAKKY